MGLGTERGDNRESHLTREKYLIHLESYLTSFKPSSLCRMQMREKVHREFTDYFIAVLVEYL